MKASEYLLNKKIVIGKKPSNIWNELKILDKTFIDKKELKEKIQTKMMGYGLDFDRADISNKYRFLMPNNRMDFIKNGVNYDKTTSFYSFWLCKDLFLDKNTFIELLE